MKAAWYEKNGSAQDVLTIGDMETPRPGAGEVLIRLRASGVNPSDVKSRRGRPLIAPRIVPHSDGAGIIEAVGDGVDAARIGERVWTWNGQWKRAFGTAAEYIALPEKQAVALPDEIDFETGACLAIPGLTAMHAVNLLGDIAGKTLLVTGAGSAVGYYIVQIAEARGARVIGTASNQKADHARSAGAEDIIDYRNEDIAERVAALTAGKGVDAIIDMDMGSTAPLLGQGVLKPHGIYVIYGSNTAGDISVSFPALLWNSYTLKVFVMYELLEKDRDRAIADLLSMLKIGKLKHAVGETFELDDIAAAHEAVENGRIVGNVVVRIA